MELATKVLIDTVEIILEEYRCELNRVYAHRDTTTDTIEKSIYQREIDRRIKVVKRLEQNLADLCWRANL